MPRALFSLIEYHQTSVRLSFSGNDLTAGLPSSYLCVLRRNHHLVTGMFRVAAAGKMLNVNTMYFLVQYSVEATKQVEDCTRCLAADIVLNVCTSVHKHASLNSCKC